MSHAFTSPSPAHRPGRSDARHGGSLRPSLACEHRPQQHPAAYRHRDRIRLEHAARLSQSSRAEPRGRGRRVQHRAAASARHAGARLEPRLVQARRYDHLGRTERSQPLTLLCRPHLGRESRRHAPDDGGCELRRAAIRGFHGSLEARPARWPAALFPARRLALFGARPGARRPVQRRSEPDDRMHRSGAAEVRPATVSDSDHAARRRDDPDAG